MEEINSTTIGMPTIGIRELIKRLEIQYREEIKPMIERREYDLACHSLFNIVTMINMGGREFTNMEDLTKVHGGLMFLASVSTLYSHLNCDERREDSINRAMLRIEAYLGRTKLPSPEDVSRKSEDYRGE